MEDQEPTLPEESPAKVGARLRAAREAAGLHRKDIAARTKIAERQLASIEEDRFSDLAGRTYAVGFARAYAREVGLDEGEIAEAVRTQLDLDEQAYPRVQLDSFEPGDPARVPPARLAWPAAIAGVLAVVVLLYLFWPGFLSPQGSLPELLRGEGETQPAAAAIDTARQQVPAGGAVVFTATAPRVWVKFYDAAGNQLFQKEMAEGERYAIPAGAQGPLLWTARPDALDITVGGKSVARLSDKPVTVKDVPVSGKALLARPGSAVSQTGPAPRPSVGAQPGAVTRARVNGPDGAAAARPAAAVSEAAAPAAIPASHEANGPQTEPLSTDSSPPSTVSD